MTQGYIDQLGKEQVPQTNTDSNTAESFSETLKTMGQKRKAQREENKSKFVKLAEMESDRRSKQTELAEKLLEDLGELRAQTRIIGNFFNQILTSGTLSKLEDLNTHFFAVVIYI